MRGVVIVLCAVGAVAVAAWIAIVLVDLSGSKGGVQADLTSVNFGLSAEAPAGASAFGEEAVSKFDPDVELEAGELLVLNPPPDLSTILRQLNFVDIDRYTFRGLDFTVARIRAPSDVTLAVARAQLAARMPGVVVDYNHRFDASSEARRRYVDSAPTSGSHKRKSVSSLAQAALGWSDVPATCGKGIRLGMVDSGVDDGHPVLKGQDIESRSFHSRDRAPGDQAHGTAVAALLVGKPTEAGLGGLLPGAELKAANMFEVNAAGTQVGSAMALVRGLDWLVREKVHVINLSIAGGKNAMVGRAVQQAAEKGIVVVAAAGNWGRADRPAFPASFEQVIAVTAIDSYEGIYPHANTGGYIDFAAPGVRLLTAAPGGGSRHQSGTSFAAPFLTAMIAMEVVHGLGANKGMLGQAMAKISKDLGPHGRDATYGWGALRVQPKC